MDCSLPGFSVHGISQARILEWVVISFSEESSQLRDQIPFPALAGGFFTVEPLGKPYFITSEFKYLDSSVWGIFGYHNWVPGSSDGKVSARNVGDLGSIPASGRSPGEGDDNPL